MNATQALSRLRKLLGPKSQIRDTRRPSSPEIRAAAQAKRLDVNARTKAAAEAVDARRKQLLEADAEYQRLHAAWKSLRAEQERTPYGNDFRYRAGKIVGDLFFSVEAEGDTLAELVEKVEAKRKVTTS